MYNGRISDMRIAAQVLKGKKINPNIRAIILPGTQKVWLQCVERRSCSDFSLKLVAYSQLQLVDLA